MAPPPLRSPSSVAGQDGSARKTRVAVTGFGPFAKVPVNPSWQCLLPLRDSSKSHMTKNGGNPMSIDFFEIPVVYHEVSERIRKLHNARASERQDGTQDPYDLFVHFGVAPSRSYWSFETGARRFGYDKEDFEKKYADSAPDPRTGKPIFGFVAPEWDQDKQGRLSSIVGVEDLAAKLTQSGDADIHVSKDAGLFLCEFTYYASLACAQRQAKGSSPTPVLFVHIPPESDTFSLQNMTETAFAVISELVDQVVSNRIAAEALEAETEAARATSMSPGKVPVSAVS